MRRAALCLTLSLLLWAGFSGRCEAQIPVTDVAHIAVSVWNEIERYAQAAEEYIQQAEQIYNQYEQIQYQLQALQKLDFHNWRDLSPAFSRLVSLIGEADAVLYNSRELEERFFETFPAGERYLNYPDDSWRALYRTMETFLVSLQSLHEITSADESDLASLAAIEAEIEGAVNYWSYYYRGSPTGFNLVAPHAGKFYGPYFYRAARSIFDIHQWTQATPPIASFQYSPGIPAPGQAVQFQSTASGSSTSYRRSFSGGLPSAPTGASVSTRWSRPGLKGGTHTACNGQGCNSISTKIGVATFVDVPPSYWAWPAIEALAVARVTSGCAVSPPQFCPESRLSRAELAVLLVRAKRGATLRAPRGPGSFPGRPGELLGGILHRAALSGRDHKWASRRLRCRPLLSRRIGYPGGDGGPSGMHEAGATYVPPAPSGVFTDVPSTNWAARYIEQLFRDGITAGCGASPRRFCPDGTVTRAESAVFLQRTFYFLVP